MEFFAAPEQMPAKMTPLSAGHDLRAAEDYTIVGGGGCVVVKTGARVKIPPGYYGRIAIRSGFAVKEHLAVSAGVIDADYDGEIGVVVFCTKMGHVCELKIAQRFAQIVFEKYLYEPAAENEKSVPREHLGWGSTGK